MDPMHFSIKRVYWSGHARIRELVVPLGITPARADLLRVVAMHEHGILQVTLMQHLGVSPPTISKMLSAMVEKGWVERFASKSGNIIHATRAGLVLIAQVIERFVLSGALPLRMAMAWGHGPGEKRESLYRLLNRARRALLDRAPFLHPWRKEPTYVRRQYTFWEARLRAEDVDDTVAEDLDKIRARAKAPIASPPPPRTAREQENIDAHWRDRDADPDGPLMWTEPRDVAASTPPHAAVGGASSDATATSVTSTSAVHGGGNIVPSGIEAGGDAMVARVEGGDVAPSEFEAGGDAALSNVKGGVALSVVGEGGDVATASRVEGGDVEPSHFEAGGDVAPSQFEAGGDAALSKKGGLARSTVDGGGDVAPLGVEGGAFRPSGVEGGADVAPPGVEGGADVAPPGVEGGANIAPSDGEGRETLAVPDVPPEVLQLWKNLMEIGNVRGLGLDDMPKWDDPGS